MNVVKEALTPEFSMLLNVALAIVPLILAALLFRPEWRRGPLWWILFAVFVGGALEIYTLSLVWLGRYMAAAGAQRWVRPMEWTMHALSALGIYLGRVIRLNSWDMFKDPVAVFTEALDAFDTAREIVFLTAAFVVIAVVYLLLKFLTLCVIEHFERRHRHRSDSDRYRSR
jgi:uncharacterized membrane protein